MVLRVERTGIEKQFFDLCSKVVAEAGYELYDLDYFPRNEELRIFIQDPTTGTAIIEDCVKIDQAMTPYIEELDWMPEQLRLEVSSPGVFRGLTNTHHFEQAQDEKIEVSLNIKLDNENYPELPKSYHGEKKLRGILAHSDDEKIELDCNDYKFLIEYKNIKKANVSPDF